MSGSVSAWALHQKMPQRRHQWLRRVLGGSSTLMEVTRSPAVPAEPLDRLQRVYATLYHAADGLMGKRVMRERERERARERACDALVRRE